MWPIVVTLLMAIVLLLARRRFAALHKDAQQADTQHQATTELSSTPTAHSPAAPEETLSAAASGPMRRWVVEVVAGTCCRRRASRLCSVLLQPGLLSLDASPQNDGEAGERFVVAFSPSLNTGLRAFLVETDPTDTNLILLSDRDELNHRHPVDQKTIALSQAQQQALVAQNGAAGNDAAAQKRLGLLVQYADSAALDGASVTLPAPSVEGHKKLLASNSPSALLLFTSREERFMFVEELNVVHARVPAEGVEALQPTNRASWASLIANLAPTPLTTVAANGAVAASTMAAASLPIADSIVNRLLRLSCDDNRGMAAMWKHILAPRFDHLPYLTISKTPDLHVALDAVAIPDGCDPFPAVSNLCVDSMATKSPSGVGTDGALHLRATVRCDGLRLRFVCDRRLAVSSSPEAGAVFCVDVQLLKFEADVRFTLHQPPSEYLWMACAAAPRCATTVALVPAQPKASIPVSVLAAQASVRSYFKEQVSTRLFVDDALQAQRGGASRPPAVSKISLRSGTSDNGRKQQRADEVQPHASTRSLAGAPPPQQATEALPAQTKSAAVQPHEAPAMASRSPHQTLPFIAIHSYISIVDREVRVAYELKREIFNVSQQLVEEDGLFRRRVQRECSVMQRRSEELQRISRGLESQTLELQRQRQEWQRERGDAQMDAQMDTVLNSARRQQPPNSIRLGGSSGSSTNSNSLPSSVEATPDSGRSKHVHARSSRGDGLAAETAMVVSPPRCGSLVDPSAAPPPSPPPLVRQLSTRCDSSNTAPKVPPNARTLAVSGLPVPTTRGVNSKHGIEAHGAQERIVTSDGTADNNQRPAVPALLLGSAQDRAPTSSDASYVVQSEAPAQQAPSMGARPPPVAGPMPPPPPPPPPVLPHDVGGALSARSDVACSSVYVSSTSSPRLVHASDSAPTTESDATRMTAEADAPVAPSSAGAQTTTTTTGARRGSQDASNDAAAPSQQASAPPAMAGGSSSSVSSSSSSSAGSMDPQRLESMDGVHADTGNVVAAHRVAPSVGVVVEGAVGAADGTTSPPLSSQLTANAGNNVDGHSESSLRPCPSSSRSTSPAAKPDVAHGVGTRRPGKDYVGVACALDPRIKDILVAERSCASRDAARPIRTPLHERLLADLTEALRIDCSVSWRAPRSTVVIRGASLAYDAPTIAAAVARGANLPDTSATPAVLLIGDVSLATGTARNRPDVLGGADIVFREVQSVGHVFGATHFAAAQCSDAASSAAAIVSSASTLSARQEAGKATPLLSSPRQAALSSVSASSTPRQPQQRQRDIDRLSPTSSSPQVEKLRLAREAAAAQFSAIQRQGAVLSARGARPVGRTTDAALCSADPLLVHKLCLVQCEESSRRADTEVAAFQFVASVRQRSAMQAAMARRHHPSHVIATMDDQTAEDEGITLSSAVTSATLQQMLGHDEECLRHTVTALEASKWASMLHLHNERLRRHCALKLAQCAAEERRKRSLLAQVAAAAYIDTLHSLQRQLLQLPSHVQSTTTALMAMTHERIQQNQDDAAAAAAADLSPPAAPALGDAAQGSGDEAQATADVASWSDWCVVDLMSSNGAEASVLAHPATFHYATFVSGEMERYHTGLAAIGAMMRCHVKRDLTMAAPIATGCVFEEGDVLLDLDGIALHSHQHMRQVLSDRALRVQARLLAIEPNVRVWTAGHYAPLRLEEVLVQEFAMEALVIRHSDVITVIVTT